MRRNIFSYREVNLWASLSPRVQEAGSGLFKVEIDKCFKDGGCEGLGELVHKGIDQPDHIERWGRLEGSGGQNLLLISSVNRKGKLLWHYREPPERAAQTLLRSLTGLEPTTF